MHLAERTKQPVLTSPGVSKSVHDESSFRSNDDGIAWVQDHVGLSVERDVNMVIMISSAVVIPSLPPPPFSCTLDVPDVLASDNVSNTKTLCVGDGPFTDPILQGPTSRS